MPTYEYECGGCGHRFDQFQGMSEKPLRTCPQCKKRKIQRLISGGAGFLFKGSGFYITDNRSDAYKTAAKKDKEASGSSSPKEPKKEAA